MTTDLDVLLATVAKLGIKLFIDGGNLRFTAPRGVLTDDLRHQLREHKSALVERLSGWDFVAQQLAAEGKQLLDVDTWLALKAACERLGALGGTPARISR